jgi:peptide/nickel transport system substrate-binding protein
MKRYLAAAIAAAVVALAPVPQAMAGKADDTMNVVWERELETLDNYFNTAREGIIVSRMVWDSLIYRNPQTLEYEPLLATSWKWVDSTTLEFEIRDGVKFHDGTTMTAEDVAYTYNWVSNPDNGYYEAGGPEKMGTAPIGTGPYKVVDVEPGRKIVFEKFDGYFDGSPKGQPAIGRIVQRTIPERNTQIAELISGRADWMWRVPADQADKLTSSGRVQVVNESTFRIGYIQMDAAGKSGDNPFKKLKVRQAVAHAINREAIVKALVRGVSEVVHAACFPPQFGCSEDVTRYEYDPDKAKKLLAEAGYPDGFTTEFYAYRERPYAEAMIGDLNKVGIKTKFNFLKYATLRDKVSGSGVPLNFMTWGSYSMNDVSAITSHFFKGSSSDLAQDKEIAALLEKGDTNIDPKVRKEAYEKALQLISERAYWVPLWTYNTNYAFSNELDFKPTSDEIPRFFTAKWK